MKFILNRDKTMTSLFGHSIEFKKGEATYVPKELWAEVRAIGAIPEEEIKEEITEGAIEPANPEERQQAIFAGFEAMVKKADRDSFTATGVPNIKQLSAHIGFIVDGKERDSAWQAFKLKDAKE